MGSEGEWVRIVVELGMGVDQHGQDPTKAVVRAVRDAVSRVCIPCVVEWVGLDPGRLRVEVLAGVPEPERVDVEEVRRAVPLSAIGVPVEVRVVEGGLRARGVKVSEFQGRSDEIYAAVTAITVYRGSPGRRAGYSAARLSRLPGARERRGH